MIHVTSEVEASGPQDVQDSLPASITERTNAVLDHAVEELQKARAQANDELQKAIAGFRQIFTTVPVEMRSNVLLKQAWSVHQALEVVRSLDAALLHLETERRSCRQEQPMAA
ncbi:MAG: hypothetical protein SF187_26875 [Deltaproteobacteria bacterium]|nr:hypothetical protein [Deltaproteobacteria bacterium]